MKILLISPLGFPVNDKTLYAGIEKLVWQYASELVKHHEVSIMGHAESIFPENVKMYGIKPQGDLFLDAEAQMFRSYQYILREFDVVHDFSHQHLASRFITKLPSINPFWHAPAIAQYPKSPYNIIGLSQWACREFRRVYHQEAKYMQSIVIDSDQYKPAGKRGDRFLTLGRMSPEKGNLSAVTLCRDLGLPIDIVGGRGAGIGTNEPLSDYEKAVLALCDGKTIQFHGEVSEEKKIELMQTCRGLIYAIPLNYQEVTSHKLQEAMLCGAPVITGAGGGIGEIVSHGIDGFLCSNEEEYKRAINNIDALTPGVTLEANRKKYSLPFVISNYEDLYIKVKEGLRW